MAISEPESCAHLVELLHRRAAEQPGKRAVTFLQDDAELAHLSYRELDCQARAIAATLQGRCAIGGRALLLYPQGLEFVSAFFGCLYAGIVAIPAPLPDPIRLKRTLPRLQSLVDDAQASLVLTDLRNSTAIAESRALSSVELVATDRFTDGDTGAELAARWESPAIDGDTLAYLQYTSGSTSAPKGVMVSHGNLMRHCAHIRQAWDYRPDSIAATWLPYFHDFGLVDGLIQPLFTGASTFAMSPVAFYMRPARWLRMISRYAVTHSQGPNFAFEHCVDKVKPEQCVGLDLSSWRTASNGSEPVAMETIDRFVAAFEPYGFRRAALYPAYGLAEATLLVATKRHGSLPAACDCVAEALLKHRVVEASPEQSGQKVRAVVSCGAPIGDTNVVIVNPDSLIPCAPSEVGEICVSGPGVALGYWRRSEETADTFRCYVDGNGPFLRTGDMGFMSNGELYVTGRIKDVIIIRGRNHYPQDIELTVAQCHPALRPGHGAAFGLEVKGRERLVVVQEVRRSHLRNADIDEIVGNIREAVSVLHEIQVYDAVLVKPGTISKTSSGKIQRSACRQRFLDATLETLEAGRADLDAAVPTPV
jgi:acyl-CoA synthetase (AMP-forming)/AMP-acid ligase II